MTTTAERHTGQGWTVDDSTFGARLALVRQRMDWNIKEAARECGLAPASWKNWERNLSEPRRLLETCLLISGRTGCDRTWLVFGPDRVREDGAITHQSSPLTPRVIARPPSRPRSRAIDDRRPAITPAARRRLAA